MKWERKKVDTFEDKRGKSNGGKIAAGGGIVGIIALLLVMFGGDTGQVIGNILQQTTQQTEQTQTTRTLSEKEKELGEFSESMLGYNIETWSDIFQQNNLEFRKPGMMLFDDGVRTACGNASSDVGPFYCPADEKIYMDLRFFEELKNRFGAKGGDFAISYVIAHEMGHHIQHLLGTNSKVRQLQQQSSKNKANQLSVAQELQADFYAGIWARYHKNLLEPGDIEEAISAAEAVGDDAIQSKMQGQVQPENFTHGTSAQRVEWFMKGFNSGDIRQGDTFSALIK